MRNLIVTLAIFGSMFNSVDIYSQSQACNSNIIECDLATEVNGVPFNMFEENLGEAPNPLCSDGGFPHNTTWFGFVAGSTTLTLNLELFNCEPGDCDGDGVQDIDECYGVQIAAYESCNFAEEVICDVTTCTPPAMQNTDGTWFYTETYTLNDLTIGDDYFILLDGCGGSYCTVIPTVTTMPGFTPEFDPTPNGGIACEDCDITDVCTGAEILFTPVNADGDEYDLSITFDWAMTVPGGGTFNDDVEGSNEYMWTFDDPGNYELCVTASTVCGANNEVCIEITVNDIADEDFGMINVCEDILANGINPNDFTGTTNTTDIINNIDLNGDGESGIAQNVDLFGSGVETFTVDNDFGCEWTQTVEIVQIDNEEEIEVITYFCVGGSVSLPGNPNVTINDFNDEADFEYTADNGCTANYLVTSWELEVDEYSFLQGACGATGIDVFFDPSSITLEDIDLDDFLDAGGTFTWIWTRGAAELPGTENQTTYNVPFGDNSQYSVLITMVITDPWTGDLVECEQSNQINTEFIQVDEAESSPIVMPVVPDVFCPEDSLMVVIGLDILGFDAAPGDFMITWTLPGEAIVVSGGTSADTQVTLDYSNTTDNTVSNEVCYEVSGTCGMPTSDCIQVAFAPSAPPVLDLQGVACPGGTFELIGNGADLTFTDLDTIFWDLSGGSLISGDTTGVGPIEVMWPDTDVTQKIVSVTVSYVEACTQYTDDVTIDFIIDPPAPTVTCFTNQNMITYEWAAVPDANEYIITLPDGSTESVTDPTYMITGLQQNECRDIEVEAVTTSGTVMYCQPITALSPVGMCCTKECPLTTAALVIPYTQSVCLGLNDAIMDFGVTYTPAGNPGNGVHNYSGPGITDPQQGTFDPSMAGVGNHIIEYYFEYTDTDIAGCRTPLASAMITVSELPTFTMSADMTTVCVGEPVTISFAGTYDQLLATNLMTNGATIIDDSDPQNIIVSWATGGTKTVTSEIDVPGCTNIPQTLEVTVDDLPTVITVNCEQSPSSIIFTWSTDPRFTDYTITLSDGTVLTTTDGMYEVTGLSPLDQLDITVVGNSSNSCPNVTSDLTECFAIECPTIGFEANLDDFFVCIDGTETTRTIEAMIDDPAGELADPFTVEIRSNGDLLTDGIFDPVAQGPGTYQITLQLRDADNCTYNDDFEIVVEDVPTLSVNALDKICITDAWELDYTGDVNGDFTYDWAVSNGTNLSGSGDQTVDFDTPGMYTLTVNAGTANCDATEYTAMVEVIDSLTTPIIQCQESVGEILFSWQDGNDECDNSYSIVINGTMVANITDVEYLVDGLMPETPVTITVINESADCVCMNKENTFTCETLACPPVIIAIADPARLICRTGTETLGMEVFDVTSTDDITAYTITYGGDATLMGNALDPNGLADGLYTITATATNGFCEASASATLEIVTIPSLAFDYDQEICVEDDLTVTYTGDPLGPFTFEWISTSPTVGFADQVSPVIMFDEPGDYEYTFMTMSDQCPGGSTAIVAVTVLDSLRTPMVTCNATLDEIELTIDVVETNCPGNVMVLLNGAPYTGDLTGGTILIEDLDAGTEFTLEVVNSSQCGCSDKSVEVMCEPDCGGVTTVTVDGVPFTGDISGNSITIDGLDAGTDVDFLVTYASNCGCDSDPDEFVVLTCRTLDCPMQDLQIINPITEWCLTDQMISSDLEVTADGVGLLPTDVVWSGLGVNTMGNITLDPADVTAGTETYTATYTLAGCEYMAETTIQYIGQPTFELEVVLPCPGEDTAILNITNAEESADIVYSLDGTPLSSLTNIPLSAGDHDVTSVAFDSCNEAESVTFNVQPDVELEIVGDTMSFAGVENPYDIMSNYTFDLIEWEFNGVVLSEGAPTTFAYFEAGELCVTGYLDDCPTTTCVNMLVNTEQVFVPNIFNPSAPDPENTTLKVFANVPIAAIANLSVYDRWGNRVFHVENADPTDVASQWDGTNATGDPLEQGVYIYAGEIEFLSGEIRKFVGDVTLVR